MEWWSDGEKRKWGKLKAEIAKVNRGGAKNAEKELWKAVCACRAPPAVHGFAEMLDLQVFGEGTGTENGAEMVPAKAKQKAEIGKTEMAGTTKHGKHTNAPQRTGIEQEATEASKGRKSGNGDPPSSDYGATRSRKQKSRARK